MKRIFLIILIVITIFSCTCVFAEDNITNDVLEVNEPIEDLNYIENQDELILNENYVDSMSKNDEVLTSAPKTFTELNDLISRSSNKKVYLTANYSYTSSDSKFKNGVSIDKDMIIYGNGHTINGMNNARIFLIQPSYYNVEFHNIIFKDAFIDHDSGGAIANVRGDVIIKNCTFINNRVTSGHSGGAIYSKGGTLNVINSNFIDNSAGSSGAISFSGYVKDFNAENCTAINNYAIGSSGAFGGGTSKNCIFINNTANGNVGALRGHSINCIFINNTASGYAGANDGNSINSTFINNKAQSGGAISSGTAENCIFINNSAEYGGAIFGSLINTNCIFINNFASYDGGAIYVNAEYFNTRNMNCIFMNNTANGKGGAIYSDYRENITNCSLINNKAILSGGAVYLVLDMGTITNCSLINNEAVQYGGAIFLLNGGTIINTNFTDNKCGIMGGAIYNGTAINSNFKDNTAYSARDMYLGSATNCVFENCDNINEAVLGTFLNSCSIKKRMYDKIIIPSFDKLYSGKKIIINFPSDATGWIILTINNNDYSFDIIGGSSTIIIPNLNNGNYPYAFTYSGDNIYSSFTEIGSLNINNIVSTKLYCSAITTVYNSGKYLLITLKDTKGNVVNGVPITVSLGGKNYNPTTKNGQVKISTNGLAPIKTYTAKITFKGNSKYAKSTTSAKVTVKKATPEITAKTKTFKKSVKTKKYSIILKTNGKVMKNTKVTIKVNKITYTTTTNKKGVATFKITKLNKKGTFKSVITYKGDAYYNKVTKKVSIKCK